jgi:hypothetical protein
MYQCINELWLYNYSFIQLPLLQSFFQNIALKGYLTQKWIGLSLFNFTEKTFLQSVDNKQPKNVKFDLSLKLSQGEPVHNFSGEVQKFAGGAKQSQGRWAPPHTSPQNPAMRQCWFKNHCYIARVNTKRDWLICGHVTSDKCNVTCRATSEKLLPAPTGYAHK